MTKHRASRDVPHPRVKTVEHFTATARAKGRARKFETELHGRVRKADGTSFPSHAVGPGIAPRRPPICMLFEDLAQGEPPTGVFGMFPESLIGKLLPWLRCKRSEVLHVCSGGLSRGDGIRVDIRVGARPDLLADGRNLPIRDASVRGVLIDPPYSEHYARELYGVDYPLPSHLLREAARVAEAGARIGFVHYLVPNPPPPLPPRKDVWSVDGIRLPDAGRDHLSEGASGPVCRGPRMTPPRFFVLTAGDTPTSAIDYVESRGHVVVDSRLTAGCSTVTYGICEVSKPKAGGAL